MFEFIRLNLKAFLAGQEGVSALEYAILVVLILAAIVIAIQNAEVSDLFESMSSVLSVANKAGS